MGVGQSRELLGKVDENCVFVCTNREELLDLFSQLRGGNEEEEEEFEFEANPTQQDVLNDTEDEAVSSFNGSKSNAELPKENEENPNERDETGMHLTVAPMPIRAVHIPNHYIGDEGFHNGVIHVIQHHDTLRYLNIAYNALTCDTVCRLAMALQRPQASPHPAMRSLNLAGNCAGRKGCEAIAQFLAADPPLRELSLFHNELYDRDVHPILQALLRNTHLQLLNFDFNYLTGKFLRMLLQLLRYNTTLAVVLYDGPYDPNTLQSLAHSHDTASEGHHAPKGVDGEDGKVKGDETGAMGTNESLKSSSERAALRHRLLRTDLAGRPPFPPDLVAEVEALLASRRAAYLAERDTASDVFGDDEKDVTFEGEEMEGEGVDKEGESCAIPLRDSDANHQDGTNEEDVNNEDANGVKGEADGDEGDYRSTVSQTSSMGKGSRHEKSGVSFDLTNADTLPPIKSSLKNGSFGRLRSDTSSSAKLASVAAYSWRSKITSNAKELSNGFDRLKLAEVGTAVPGCRTACTYFPDVPRRLRACWCDPHDVAAPYGSTLHYHCRHEPTGGDLGDIGTDGIPLGGGKGRKKGPRASQQQRDALLRRAVAATSAEEKKVTYTGCKETSHRCASLGFYGQPRNDKSSVYFFSSQHPMQAQLYMDGTSN